MQKKSRIFKKRNLLGQALDLLPPRKSVLYISIVDFFYFEYHEFSIIDLIKYKQNMAANQKQSRLKRKVKLAHWKRRVRILTTAK